MNRLGNGHATPSGVTKRDLIAQELRAMIAAGQIPRGSRMRQDELAEKFNTSITPVREALRMLQAEGLLTGQSRRGVRVAEVDIPQLRATYIMRRLLEPYAMRRAARRVSSLDIERAKHHLERMQEAIEAGDDEAVRASNRAFHFLFIERCGFPELVREIDNLWLNFPWDVLQVLERRPERSMDEHVQMLQALVNGDLDALAEATERHLSESYLSLAEYLTGSRPRDPFDVDSD